jgi:hypothetical protein
MRQAKGVALIAALLIMVVVLILVFGTAFTSMVDRMVSANQRGATDAYYVARAGAEKYKTVAFQAFRFYLENIHLYNDELSSGNPTCGNFLSIGLDLNRNGVLTDQEDLIHGRTVTGSEGNGTYEVTFEIAGKYIVITSVGRVGRARSTVQLVAQPRNAGALSYALFAGEGQQNKFINGGASIYGSVYVEGNEAAPEVKVIESNGNFSMHNYYTAATLQDLIKDNTRRINVQDFLRLNAVEQKDLCGTLRVKNGKVEVGGSTTIGNQTAPSGFKANMAGVHVGADPTYTTTTGGASIHADLRTEFDLEAPLSFPVLDTDAAGETYCDKKRASNKTWRQCMREDAENTYLHADASERRGLVITETSPFASFAASMEVNPSTGRSYCQEQLPALLSGGKITFGTQNVNCIGYDGLTPNSRKVGFSYSYNTTTKVGTLEVHGLINFRGLDIEFKEDVLVRFTKEAGFFVETLKYNSSGQLLPPETPLTQSGVVLRGGNVTVDGDLLPSNSFPDVDVLGIVAERQFYMTGDNQQIPNAPSGQVAAGVFYAGELAVVAKSATVFGTVMAPRFCTTSNCNAGQKANLVQVPGLEYKLAPGIAALDGTTIPTYRVVSFERR